MRLLIVSPYPPVRDGIGDYSSALVEALRAQGHVVAVVAARSRDGALAPEAIGELPGPHQGVDELVARVRDFTPDIVHVQFAVAGYGLRVRNLLALLAALRGGPARIVITMHEVTRDTDSLRGPGAGYAGLAHRADLCVVHNRRAAQALAALAPGVPFEVLPHPKAELPDAAATPDEVRAKHGLAGRRVLLAFGFVHVDKGLDVLVAALARLRREPRLADVALLVAGAVRPRHGAFKPFEWRDRLHLRQVRRAIARDGLETPWSSPATCRPTRSPRRSGWPRSPCCPTGASTTAASPTSPWRPARRWSSPTPARCPSTSPTRRAVWRTGDADGLARALAAVLDAPGGDAAAAGGTAPGAPFDEVLAATLALYAAQLAGRDA